VGLCVFEAEDELDILVVDEGCELSCDVFCSGLVLAMDESNFSAGLFGEGVEYAAGIGVEGPVLLLPECCTAHVLSGGEADAFEEGICKEHLFDALAEVVDGGFVGDAVRDAVFAAGAVDEDVPGDEVEVDVAILCVLHYLSPEGDFFIDSHFPDGFEVVEDFGAVETPS